MLPESKLMPIFQSRMCKIWQYEPPGFSIPLNIYALFNIESLKKRSLYREYVSFYKREECREPTIREARPAAPRLPERCKPGAPATFPHRGASYLSGLLTQT